MFTMNAGQAVGILAWVGRNTPLGRGGIRRLLVAWAKRLASEPIQSTFRGVPTIFYPDNLKALFHAYDRCEMDFLRSYLTEPGSVFVDVGANSGLYTQWLASQMTHDAKIVAIEPNPVMCARMLENIRLLPSGPKISVECCAAGDIEGEGFLDISQGAGRASLIGGTGLRVPVRPLQAILTSANCNQVTALKIDVEGYEDKVLCPFFRDVPLAMWPSAIVIEHVYANLWSEDAIEFLCSLGYSEVGRTRANLLLSLKN